MAAKRLTELTLTRTAAPKTGRLELADATLPGFAVRITPDGTRTFALRFRVAGKQRRLTLGRYPVIGLVEARQRAREALQLVERGLDPTETKLEAKRERAKNTVAAVVADYSARHLRKNTRGWHAAERMLALDVLPRWGERPIQSISRRDVLDLVDAVVDRGSPVSANRTLSLVKRFLNWAVQRGILEANVATAIKPPHRERPRERTLTADEIMSLWPAWSTQGYPFGVLAQLLLLTGQRRGEIAGLRWADLDLAEGVLRLPGTATKTGVEHHVPISAAAVEILRTLPRIGDSPLVFPANRANSTNPVSGFSRPLLAAYRLSGTANWHYHDLRRTTATGMAKMNVPPHVVEKILNHTATSLTMVARTYNTHSYQAEMRQAVERWADEVIRIVAGAEARVVPMRAAG